MILKRAKILAVFLLLLFIGGCKGDIPYDADLFIANENNCWPCKMYMQAFMTLDRVLDGSLESIARNSLTVLEIALLFWLLFRIGFIVFSFAPIDMKKQLATAVPVLFKALIVAIFLNNPTYIYDFFGKIIIQPFGDGFLSMADTVLASPSHVGINNINYTDVSGYLGRLGEFWRQMLEAVSGSSSSASSVSGSRMFGELAVKVQEMVFKIYDALWRGVGLGFQLWMVKGWSAAIAGIILIAGMFWLVVMMPLSFVDAFIRIGLILMLLPLLMVGWVFSFPKDIVKKVVHNIFAGFFDILFSCIYITFLISLFRVYENQKLNYLFSSSAQTTEGAMRTLGERFGTDFLILTLLVWSMVKLAGKIQDFANYFFEGAQKSSIYDTVNQLKNLAMKGVRVGAALLSGPAGWVTGAAGLAKDAVQQAANGGEQENNGSSGEDGSNDGQNSGAEGGDQNSDSNAGKKDNSQKASSSRSAPPQKDSSQKASSGRSAPLPKKNNGGK